MSENLTSSEIYLPSADEEILRFADDRIAVATNEQEMIIDGVSRHIPRFQHSILTLLASWPDHSISSANIMMNVWGRCDERSSQALRNHTRKLRTSLGVELGNANNGAIASRFGIGYSALSTLYDMAELPPNGGDIYTFANDRLAIQPKTWLMKCDDKVSRRLTRNQFQIMEMMAEQVGKIVKWEKFEERLGYYHSSQDTPSIIRIHVHRLRSRLPADLSSQTDGAIRAARNIGYWVPRLLSDTDPDLSTQA